MKRLSLTLVFLLTLSLIAGLGLAGVVSGQGRACTVTVDGKPAPSLDGVLPGQPVRVECPALTVRTPDIPTLLKTDLERPDPKTPVRWEVRPIDGTPADKYEGAAINLKPGDYDVIITGQSPPTVAIINGERLDGPRTVNFLRVGSSSLLSGSVVSDEYRRARESVIALGEQLGRTARVPPSILEVSKRAQEHLNEHRPANALLLAEAGQALLAEYTVMARRADQYLFTAVVLSIVVIAILGWVYWWKRREARSLGRAGGEIRSQRGRTRR